MLPSEGSKTLCSAFRRFAEVGRSRRVPHACTRGAGSTRVPSGDGSSRHWGANHRTLWQSEESGVRRHRVPQTTSQPGLQRASWALHRDCPRPSDAAEAACTGARRANRCVTQVDRHFSLDAQRHRCPTNVVADDPHQQPWSGQLARGTRPGQSDALCIQREDEATNFSTPSQGQSFQQHNGVAMKRNRREHGSVVPKKSRASRGHKGEK